MLKRQLVTHTISGFMSQSCKGISCLGRISRDIYAFSTKENKYDCFYQLGAMGSALPFGLGLALTNNNLNFIVIEGDGSILMNLGGLVTYKRYSPGNLSLFILDNRQYETTGGQCSQPENFELVKVCEAIGLSTILVTELSKLVEVLTSLKTQQQIPEVIVIQTIPDTISPRIIEQPKELARKFCQQLIKPGIFYKRLTTRQINQWNAQGYLRLKKFYPDELALNLKSWVSELANRPETKGKWMRYYETNSTKDSKILCRIENFIGYHEQLREILYEDRIRDILTQLFGEPPCLFKEKINFKLPGANGFAPHQDEPAYSIFRQEYHITVMICIDDSTISNGCLEFAPGRHKEGILEQERNGDLANEIVQELEWEKLEAKAGDILIFDSFIPHKSGPNITDTARRALFATYNRFSAGDMRNEYFKQKRIHFPPEYEREPGYEYSGANPFNLGNPIK